MSTSSNNQVKPSSSAQGGGLTSVLGPPWAGNSNKISSTTYTANKNSNKTFHTMYYPLEMRLYDAQKTIQRIAQGHSSDGITRLHASSAVLDIYEGLSPCVSDHVMRHGFNFREKMSPIQHLDSERRDISEKDYSDCRYLVTVMGSLQTILKAGRPRTTLGGDNSHERALSSLLYESEDVWFFAEVVLTMKAIYDDHGRGDTKPRDFPTDADKVLATMREASNTGIPLPAEILVHLCLSSGDSVNEEEEGTT